MQLRDYQTAAVNACWEFISTQPGNPVIVLPTGAGKSLVLAKLAHDAATLWNGRVILLAHVKELLEQNAEKLKAISPDLDIGVYSAGLKKRDRYSQVLVAGIQSVYQRATDFDPFDLIIVDECHLLPPDGEGMYRQFLADCKTLAPHVRLIGLTATPYRMTTGWLCGPDNLLTDICYEAGVKEMIQAGWLSKLISKEPLKLDTSGLHVRGGEFVQDEATALMADVIVPACKEILERTENRKSVLVFTQSVDHCHQVAKTIREVCMCRVEVVTGDTPAAQRAEILRDFKSGAIKYLVNVNVLTTGFDAPNVDCVCLLRPTLSPGLYYQMCLDYETEILTNNGWKTHRTIEETDLVWAVDSRNYALPAELVSIESIINRPVAIGESFYSISNNSVDIRVTGKHELLVSNRRQKHPRWEKETADIASQRLAGFRIPVSSMAEATGVPLSDDELRLIGWFITDGNINKHNNCLTITQGVESTSILEIRRVLLSCGLKWRETIIPASSSQFENAKDRIHFRVSKGMPRGEDKYKKGWNHLGAYLKKHLADELFACTQNQFEILLSAINLGDGCKRKTINWVARTISICTGMREFADRLQTLAVLRGYRCNIATGHYNANPIYVLHIKKQGFRAIGGPGQKDRECLLESQPANKEHVWCIRNRLGTIITRRNGKVAIVGNCGRGFRISPNKENCLVLDFGGNVRRHGPVDQIQPKPRQVAGSGNGEAPTKDCPECKTICHAGYSTCPDCGHEFPDRNAPKHDANADSAPVTSLETVRTEHKVIDVGYFVHQPRDGRTPSMRVDYKVNPVKWHSEWICIEHDGYAGSKAKAWWRARSHDEFPDSVERAVEMANAGSLALTEEITIEEKAGEKWPRVVKAKIGQKPERIEVENPDEDFDFPIGTPEEPPIRHFTEEEMELPF